MVLDVLADNNRQKPAGTSSRKDENSGNGIRDRNLLFGIRNHGRKGGGQTEAKNNKGCPNNINALFDEEIEK